MKKQTQKLKQQKRKANQKYRKTHKAEIKIYNKQYYNQNKPEINIKRHEYNQNYYQANQEKLKNYQRQYYWENHDTIREYDKSRSISRRPQRRGHTLQQYWPGSTWQEALQKFQDLFQQQNGLCAICHQPESIVDHHKGKLRDLSVDHNHKTGKVRGLLCFRCNKAIGILEDNPTFFLTAAQYLKE